MDDWLITLEEARIAANFCDSYQRLPEILGFEGCMDESDWLTLLGENWNCCDNIGAYIDELRESRLFDGWRPIPEMMTVEERGFYARLADTFVVYRGCYARNKWGLSWSLSRGVAEKFPFFGRYRQSGQPIMVKAIAHKRDVLAVKLDRNEAEIITWRPKHISTSHIKDQSAVEPSPRNA
jgi:hypothetical protein